MIHSCIGMPSLLLLPALLMVAAATLTKADILEEIPTAWDVINGTFFATAAEISDLDGILEQWNISQFTFFVPSDLAVAQLDESDVTRLLNPLWKSHLLDLLLYHVVEGEQTDVLQMVDETGAVTLQTLQGTNVKIARSDFAPDLSNSAFVQNTKTRNGILYFTNRVFRPSSMTNSLRELMIAEDRFSTLFEILQLANLEQPLSETGPVTLFAPTNEAWDALDPALLSSLQLPSYRAELLEVLSGHVIWEDIRMSSDWVVGDVVDVLLDGETFNVTSVHPIIFNGTVKISSADILATNGVLQEIDKVILPVGFELKPKVSSIFASSWREERWNAEMRLNIVALGDSYIAGNGARGPDGNRDYADALCYRSDSSWAGLYATCVAETSGEKLDVSFFNHACSGSKIADVYANQLSGVTSRTDLVFLSMGGNDVGFIDVVPPCYIQRDPALCEVKIAEAEELMGGDLQSKLKQLLIDIHAAGHEGMKIVFSGAPYYGNDINYTITDQEDSSIYPVGEVMYAASDLLELIQKQAVAEANNFLGKDVVVFESVKSLFHGKEFDANPELIRSDSWMIGLDPIGTFGFQEENYHYNYLGHQGLGSYLCTRVDYGASQPIDEADSGFSRTTLLVTLLMVMMVALMGLLSLIVGFRHFQIENNGLQCSQRWSATIALVHAPMKAALKATTTMASMNPKSCIVMCIFVSLSLFIAGLATNFTIVSEQEALWTPQGSRSESERAWVESMQHVWSNHTTRDDILLTMIVHKNGDNMVTDIGARKLFEALDAVRNTRGYGDFCALHGEERLCPSGYEHICKLYSIPTSEDGSKDCLTFGATGFWFHNLSLYEEQVLSDSDVSKAMSLDIFLGGQENFNPKDVLGYPVYEEGLLTSSTAFLSFVMFPKNAEGVEELRQSVIETLLNLQEDWKSGSYDIQFLTTGSFSDEFLRSIENDIFLFPAVFPFMAAFTVVCFIRRDPSRGALGLGAVFTVLLSILAGYGILFAIGVPLTSLTQILPFCILGIGLDDSFLLKDAYERSDPSKEIVDRIDETIDEIGISIVMTSFTSSLAFALGCLSSIPSVRWLCIYGFATILIDFFFQITLFLAFLVLDERRIKASKKDLLCCFKTSNVAAPASSTPLNTSVDERMTRYSKLLLQPTAQILVILLFFLLFCGCAVATTRLQLGFDFTSVLPADSYVISFSNDLEQYTQRRIDADLYFRDVDQGDSSVQEQMKKYVNELVDGVDAVKGPPSKFWVTDYQDYLDQHEDILKGMPFNETILRFLDDPRFNHYESSIILSDSGDIVASRTQISFENLDVNDGKQVLTAINGQRKISSEQSINAGRDQPAFFTFNSIYYLWDFLIQTEAELKMTTIIGVASVSTMALFFLPHWSGIFFVLPMIVSLYVDMLGILYLAGIDINGVSFVSIVLSLGLYVDYILHVLLCYYEISEPSREQKVSRMLGTVGVSVLLGGMSTLFGTLPLAFTSSEVFYTVFIAFVSIVVLGLGHGLILLPVLLSLVGPTGTDHSEMTGHEEASESEALPGAVP